jgi:hypothetical protein
MMALGNSLLKIMGYATVKDDMAGRSVKTPDAFRCFHRNRVNSYYLLFVFSERETLNKSKIRQIGG